MVVALWLNHYFPSVWTIIIRTAEDIRLFIVRDLPLRLWQASYYLLPISLLVISAIAVTVILGPSFVSDDLNTIINYTVLISVSVVLYRGWYSVFGESGTVRVNGDRLWRVMVAHANSKRSKLVAFVLASIIVLGVSLFVTDNDISPVPSYRVWSPEIVLSSPYQLFEGETKRGISVESTSKVVEQSPVTSQILAFPHVEPAYGRRTRLFESPAAYSEGLRLSRSLNGEYWSGWIRGEPLWFRLRPNEFERRARIGNATGLFWELPENLALSQPTERETALVSTITGRAEIRQMMDTLDVNQPRLLGWAGFVRPVRDAGPILLGRRATARTIAFTILLPPAATLSECIAAKAWHAFDCDTNN